MIVSLSSCNDSSAVARGKFWGVCARIIEATSQQKPEVVHESRSEILKKEKVGLSRIRIESITSDMDAWYF
jgi:hypothetical protein